MTGPAHSPIEDYLDRLMIAAPPLPARDLRQLLAEAEAHLYDSAAQGEADGLSEFAAQTAAVRGFGTVDELVAAEHARLGTPLIAMIRQVASTVWLLGAIGALAVGVSGLLALVVRLAAGSRFLVDAPQGADLTASNCARWLAVDPGAHSCRDAALADWGDEVVGYRLVAGAIGLIALVLFIGVRKRWNRLGHWSMLPPVVSDTIAVTAFTLAGAWTLVMGIDALVVASGHGSGQWLSAAPVALGAAVLFGARVAQDLRHSPAAGPVQFSRDSA